MPAPERTPDQWVELITEHAERLAESLRLGVDSGVSPALILPALISVFREAFGEMPAGMSFPGLPMLGGGS